LNITDISFVVIYLIFPFFIMSILKCGGVRFTRFSIPSFVMLFMFVFAYLGILPLYFAWDEHRFFYNGVQDKAIILQMFIYSSWTILAMSFGMVAASGLLGRQEYSFASNDKRNLSRRELFFLFVFVLICGAVFVVYLTKIPSVALFAVFSDGFVEGRIARSQMGHEFVGKYHWYKLFMKDGLFLATFILYADWLLRSRRGVLVSLLLFGTFSAAVFSALSSIEKEPVAILILGMFLVYVAVKKRCVYPFRTVFLLMSITIAILVGAYMLFIGSENISIALKIMFSRIFTGQLTPSYWYIEYFPRLHDFLAGSSLPNPGGIFPFEGYSLTVEIKNYFASGVLVNKAAGSAPTVFWGEMYANFGLMGVIIPPFFVGAALYWVAFLLDKIENTSLKVGLVVAVAIHFKDLCGTGLSGFLVDTNLLGMVGFVFIIMMLGNYCRVKIFYRATRV